MSPARKAQLGDITRATLPGDPRDGLMTELYRCGMYTGC